MFTANPTLSSRKMDLRRSDMTNNPLQLERKLAWVYLINPVSYTHLTLPTTSRV